jgi:signal transduction histidine kinase
MVMLELDEPPRQLRADMLRFARGVTHEFNNTLASIQGFAEIAASLAVNDSPMQTRALQNILRGCEHAEAAIRTARIMVGRADCKLIPIDLAETVQTWLDDRKGALPERVRASLSMHDTSGEHTVAQTPCRSGHHALLQVLGDSQLLEQALDALWDNALHALADGGEIIVNVSSRDDGAMVALEVLDTGSGMTADVLAACAEPYFTTRESEGAKGLGLSLARGIAWLHNGYCFVESSPEKGTMVRLLLPVTGRTAGSEIATYREDAGKR